MWVEWMLHSNFRFLSSTDKRITFIVSLCVTFYLFYLLTFNVSNYPACVSAVGKRCSLQIHICLVWVAVSGKVWKWSVCKKLL